MIVRLIIYALLIWLGLTLYRRYRRHQDTLKQREAPASLHDGSPMVRCAYCRVHVPKDEALVHDRQWFCCTAHRQQFLEHGPRNTSSRG